MLADIPVPEKVEESSPARRDNSIIKAYNFMYDKKEHYDSIKNTYWFVIEHPPKQVDPVSTSLKYLNSLTDAELDEVTFRLNMQIEAPKEKDVDVVKQFMRLDEMAQYKFFCGIRDMFDDEDWATLTDKE